MPEPRRPKRPGRGTRPASPGRRPTQDGAGGPAPAPAPPAAEAPPAEPAAAPAPSSEAEAAPAPASRAAAAGGTAAPLVPGSGAAAAGDTAALVPGSGAEAAGEIAAARAPASPAAPAGETVARTPGSEAEAAPAPASRAAAAGDTAPRAPGSGAEAARDAAAAPAPGSRAEAAAASTPRTAYEALWSTGLPNVLALARRDLSALFLWPAAYAIAAVLIVPVSILGYLMPALAGQPVTMEGVFGWLALVAAFLTPLVTMRLLTAELRSGALDLVLASPVRFWEVTVAKWLAALAFFLAASAFTLLYVALLAAFQPGLDGGAIAAGYVGLVLVGSAWVALSLLAASLTRNPLVAVVAGAAALLALRYVAGTAAGFLSPPLSDLLDYASAANRAQSFDRGRIVLRDAVYFLTLTAGGLFLTARVLAARRWR